MQDRTFIPIVFLIFLYQACYDFYEAGNNLIKAEQLEEDCHDSPLWLQKHDVPKAKVSKKQYVDWYLRVTKEQDIIINQYTSDSLINRSAEFYTRDGKSDRQLLTYYYIGRIDHDLNNVTKATVYYLKEIEVSVPSNYYALTKLILNNKEALDQYNDVFYITQTSFNALEASTYKTEELYILGRILKDIEHNCTIEKVLDNSIIYCLFPLPYTDNVNIFRFLNGLGFLDLGNKYYRTAFYYEKKVLNYLCDLSDYYLSHLESGESFYDMGKSDFIRYCLHGSINSSQLVTQADSYYYYFMYTKVKKKPKLVDYAPFQKKYDILKDSTLSQKYNAEILKMQHFLSYQPLLNKLTKAQFDPTIMARNNIILIVAVVVLSGCLIANHLYGHLSKIRKQKLLEELINNFTINQNQECKELIKTNKQRIDALESKLSAKATNDKEILRLEKKLLEIENEQMSRINIEKEKRKIKLVSSWTYNMFIREPIKNITQRDKGDLISIIDEVYPEFRFRIINLYPTISEDDLFICYLVKANVKRVRIAQIMYLSKQAISMRLKRLAVMMLGVDSSTKSLDNYISSS